MRVLVETTEIKWYIIIKDKVMKHNKKSEHANEISHNSTLSSILRNTVKGKCDNEKRDYDN